MAELGPEGLVEESNVAQGCKAKEVMEGYDRPCPEGTQHINNDDQF